MLRHKQNKKMLKKNNAVLVVRAPNLLHYRRCNVVVRAPNILHYQKSKKPERSSPASASQHQHSENAPDILIRYVLMMRTLLYSRHGGKNSCPSIFTIYSSLQSKTILSNVDRFSGVHIISILVQLPSTSTPRSLGVQYLLQPAIGNNFVKY